MKSGRESKSMVVVVRDDVRVKIVAACHTSASTCAPAHCAAYLRIASACVLLR